MFADVAEWQTQQTQNLPGQLVRVRVPPSAVITDRVCLGPVFIFFEPPQTLDFTGFLSNIYNRH